MPLDFITLILNSSLFLLSIFSALEVIKYSARSISFNILNFLLSLVIFKSASKIEPISLLALFSSIAIFATSFILNNSLHFSSKILFFHELGIFGKVYS